MTGKTESTLAARFRQSVESFTNSAADSVQELGIAVSGGPDSLALLLLATEIYPHRIAAATVDHGLRDESSEEAAHVASICADIGVPHTTLIPASTIEGSIQSAAREIRYALLDEWRARESLGWVATAHHADDQLETILMRLLRGSGVDGLSAIRPVNGRIIRPLLDCRKQELENYVRGRGFAAIDDPSNRDARYDRARLRQALKNFPDFDPLLLARSAGAVREASEALAWIADREAEQAIREDHEGLFLYRSDYPPELLRRLVLKCLARLAPDFTSRGAALERFVKQLESGNKAMIGEIIGEDTGNSEWRFSPAPPRKTG